MAGSTGWSTRASVFEGDGRTARFHGDTTFADRAELKVLDSLDVGGSFTDGEVTATPGQLAHGRGALQGPHARGPDGDDAPGRTARLPGRRRHAIALAVHRVLTRVGRADRSERVGPDDQLDVADLDARGGQRAQQLGGQVQPGRRQAATEPGSVA